MDIRKLQYLIVDALEDVKAQDIQVFDTMVLTSLFDRVIVASGTSNRQTRALANSVHDKVKAAGGYIASTEGEDTGEWVLVDCGDAIVHIMQPVIRQYYHLEDIWGGKPVDVKKQYKAFTAEGSPEKAATRKAPKRKAMKMSAGKTQSQQEALREKVSQPEITPKVIAEKKAAAKTAAKKAPAKKTAAKTAAKKAPAAKKLPPARKTATKVYVAKAPAKTAAKKAGAGKKK